MPMLAKFAFIDGPPANPVVVLGYPRRHLGLLARFITNLVRLAHPAPLWLIPTQPIYIKTSTHCTIISRPLVL